MPPSEADTAAGGALARVRIVLVRPSHPGNVGAAARAMRTMGLGDLRLVAPQRPLGDEAYALAAGGADLLDRHAPVATLDEAVADCIRVFGCSARSRTVTLPLMEPHDAANALVLESDAGPVALVFGNERTGLTNAELVRCSAQVIIPADPDYPSLNLASAVQIAAYELRRAALRRHAVAAVHNGQSDSVGTSAEFEGLMEHLFRTLFAIDFFKGRVPDTLMRRLRRLGQKSGASSAELALVRGILSDVERVAKLSGIEPRPVPVRRPRR